MNNSTNDTIDSIPDPPTYKIVLGCLAFFLVLPFVLVPIRRYPLGSTGAVLVGAFLMVITTVIDQKDVYRIIGDMNNLKTIFLLWGMMIISSYFERERLIDILLNKLFPSELAFHWWIIRLSVIDSILAALFTNDVACVILTPLILNRWIDQKRNKYELNTLLLTLATQANIGSTLTIFGNPQMALMASKSNAYLDPHSRLDLKACVEFLWLPTFVVWLLNICFLLLHYYLSKRHSSSSSTQELPEDDSNNKEIVEQTSEIEQPSIFVTMTPEKIPRFTQRYRLRQLKQRQEEDVLSIPMRTVPLMIDRSISVPSLVSFDADLDGIDDEAFKPSESRLFKIILFILLLTVVTLLFASSDKVYFDIGLIPVGAAIILLVADTLINHQPPILILTRIDWNVLLLFFGLFVWLDGLNSTGIPHRIWVGLDLETATFTNFKSLLLFFIFTIIGSNVFSNVPLTLLVLQQVPLTGNHLNLILYLAFLTTVAGNLTLFGSVANLIVAQKALTSSIKHKFNFWIYFKFGFPTTILFSFIGMFIIYGLLEVIH